MTLLQTKVVDDWKIALKNRDPKKDPLSMIITELKNRAIADNLKGDAGRVISDELAISVLQKMAKQRQESIETYRLAKREELAKKEEFELSVINSYLPKAMTDDELRALVSRIIEENGASSMKDLGKIIPKALLEAAGRADGKRIQNIAQSMLTK
jgi:uncharacterized protein YqeY